MLNRLIQKSIDIHFKYGRKLKILAITVLVSSILFILLGSEFQWELSMAARWGLVSFIILFVTLSFQSFMVPDILDNAKTKDVKGFRKAFWGRILYWAIFLAAVYGFTNIVT